MPTAPARGYYAVARLRTRYAQLLRPQDWQVLERVQQFAAFLQHARATPLRTWVLHFDAGIEPHKIEASLRNAWLKEAAEVAEWLPASEQAAAAALGRLALLPVFRHRAGGGELYAWMPPVQPEEHGKESDGAALLRDWLSHWQASWPPSLDGEAQETLKRWRDQALALVHERSGSVAARRDAWDTELRRGFRRQHGSLVCACAYIGLLWLQLARLRGALLTRRLFVAANAGAV